MKTEALRKLAFWVLASCVVAQTLSAQPTNPPRNPNPFLAVLDEDKDGELSAGEIAAAPSALVKLDKNRDGEVQGEELSGLLRSQVPRGRGGRGGGPGGGSELELVSKFDTNNDGRLLGAERAKAREEAQRLRAGGRRNAGGGDPVEPGRKISPYDVDEFPGVPLYDPSTIRTFFLELPLEAWESELEDFYRTDVLVPATLQVDGDTYPDVGVSFRGNSSFFTVRRGQKRSINLVMDFANKKQNLAGYRTLNLLNAHTDPSFLREVTFNLVARHYIPAPKANFVRLVINGEDWGIYVNSQQMNKEFTEEWFGSRGGVRWKIRAGGGARAMNYNGDDPKDYKELYEAKSNESERAWADLIRACRDLGTIPVEQLDSRLDRILDVDRALWFLAMDNVLIDSDGYYSRGSDYMVYQEPKFGRFHLLPYDSNETFRYPGGGGPGGGSNIRVEGVKLSPFAGEENEARPLLNRLMANQNIRARYLAHVRTIVDEWFESGRLEETLEALHHQISDYVAEDSRKLYGTDQFLSSLTEDSGSGRRPTPGLKSFVSARREYFREFPDFEWKAPQFVSVELEEYEKAPEAGQPVGILAKVSPDIPVDEVLLYYASHPNDRFRHVVMSSTKTEGVFRGEVPGMPAGSRIHYYVEGRRHVSSHQRTVSQFWPRNTVLGAESYRIVSASDRNIPVVISEVMPSNVSAARDPQGDFDDWIELHNLSDGEVDLSGMFLTDDLNDLRQWSFPTGTKLSPNGYVLVWADGDTKKARGLHADFKLSANGETIFLVDTDANGNGIVDQLTFPAIEKNEAYGRLDSGQQAVMPPTPGRANR